MRLQESECSFHESQDNSRADDPISLLHGDGEALPCWFAGWLTSAVRLMSEQALDLAAEATSLKEFKDWWWKARLGKCYYKLGVSVPSRRSQHTILHSFPFSSLHRKELFLGRRCPMCFNHLGC